MVRSDRENGDGESHGLSGPSLPASGSGCSNGVVIVVGRGVGAVGRGSIVGVAVGCDVGAVGCGSVVAGVGVGGGGVAASGAVVG
jgi:hypothetical protein